MENEYDVGIANRYALFLEEGENSLTAIKKKLSKETRKKNKAIKKETAEAKKVEALKTPEKPKKPEPKPATDDVLAIKKEIKEDKTDVPKPKEKKLNDTMPIRKDREPQEKSRNVKNGEDSAVNVTAPSDVSAAAPASDPVEPAAEKDFSKSSNENGPPRKNYERRPPRERKFENSDQNQSSRPYPNQYTKRNNNNSNGNGNSYFNNSSSNNNNNNSISNNDSNNFNKDSWDSKDWSDSGGATGDNATTDRYQNNENRNVRENGYGPHSSNEYRPRGGGRFRGGDSHRGGGRGGGNFRGADRRKDLNDQRNEQKDDSNVFKSDSWGDEKVENSNEITDNQQDEENKATENDASGTDEQAEVKEYLTLDEWKKLQGQRQKPQYNLRKAGEGEDLTQWKNMRELEKKKDEEFLETQKSHEKSNHHEHEKVEKENLASENAQRVGRQKHIDIKVHFRESSIRRRGGRGIRNNRFDDDGGGRGRGRGGVGFPGDGGGRGGIGSGGGGFKGRNEDRDRNDNTYGGESRTYSGESRPYGGESRPYGGESRTYAGESRSYRKPRENFTRGGGNRGAPANRQNAPKMDDESAFPSLG